MDSSPFVSIIMATFNSHSFIQKALDSVCAQQCNFDVEILIGDDMSNDNTSQILKAYSKKHPEIRVFWRTENIGAAQNYLLLLRETRGKYLALLDGDDYWTDPMKLQKQVDFLETHPEFIGCTHKFKVVNEKDKAIAKLRISFVKERQRFSFKDFKGHYLPGQPSTFLRKNIFLERKNIDLLEKYAFLKLTDRFSMALFLSYGDFGLIKETMSVYRVVEQSITSSEKARTMSEYDITHNLELFCSDIFGKPVRFEQYRRDLFLSAVAKYICGDKNALNVIRSIKSENGKLFPILIYSPVWLVKKIFTKLTCSR